MPVPGGQTTEPDSTITRLTERVPGTHNIPGHIIGGIENSMGNQVHVMISHDGRYIVHSIKRCVENDATQHQYRKETRFLVLPEDTGDGNHQGEQGQYSQEHAGNHADSDKTCCGHGIAFHEMFLDRCHVECGGGRNGSKKHRSRNEYPVPFIEFHITQSMPDLYLMQEADEKKLSE
jgi:hypothetical protein